MRRTPPTRWAFTATADAMVMALIVLKDTENEYPVGCDVSQARVASYDPRSGPRLEEETTSRRKARVLSTKDDLNFWRQPTAKFLTSFRLAKLPYMKINCPTARESVPFH